MAIEVITDAQYAMRLSWVEAVEALRAGHQRPKAQMSDNFLGPSDGTLLNRSAYIEGLGFGVKCVTIFDGNSSRGLPTVQGAMMMFSPTTGELSAIIESKLVTALKTAADSVLGATYLARPNSRRLLVVGAGTVARTLLAAYPAIMPHLTGISIWSRRPEQAHALANEFTSPERPVVAVADLARAAAGADIISCATMAREPVLMGDWVQPGTHVDLIGAFKKDMREADDALMSRSALFVDSRESTIGHIGELAIPIANGVISETDIRGDLYDLVSGSVEARKSANEITVFKNGGGAHLDLMMANYIASKQ